MTKRRVLAIGLDSLGPALLDFWRAQGVVPNIARLLDRGSRAICTYDNRTGYTAETPWTVALTGCAPAKTGYWSPAKYTPDYAVREQGAYDFETYKPFYAYAKNARTIAFDVAQTRLVPGLNGLQALAWGAHSPQVPPASDPPELLPQLIENFGAHPAFNRDWSLATDARADAEGLCRALIEGAQKRGRICAHLMETQDWDFFVTIFGEPHSAGHSFWHETFDDHPLQTAGAAPRSDRFARAIRAVDDAVGAMLDAAPDDAAILLFAQESMKANSSDLASGVFLTELLYRMSFPGSAGLIANGQGPIPPLTASRPDNWLRALWANRVDGNSWRRRMRAAAPLRASQIIERIWPPEGGARHPYDSTPFDYMPSQFFAHLWPTMKAFALPSFSDGAVRINLKGREAHGIVAPADYDRVCAEIESALHALRDARTGAPVVKWIERTRRGANAESDRLPDADLVIRWRDEPFDVVESPDFGRIGPLPYRRTGDHVPEGFLGLANSDGAALAPACDLTDIAPTILALLGEEVPGHMDGRARVRHESAARKAAS